jgi:hypothetical protein
MFRYLLGEARSLSLPETGPGTEVSMVLRRTRRVRFAFVLAAVLVGGAVAEAGTCGCSVLRQACEKVATARRDAARSICDDGRDACETSCQEMCGVSPGECPGGSTECGAACSADRVACRGAAEDEGEQAKDACNGPMETCRSLCSGPVDADCVSACRDARRECIRGARAAETACRAACPGDAARRRCLRACRRELLTRLEGCWAASLESLKPCLLAPCVDDGDCDDRNRCTQDRCDPDVGCVSAPEPDGMPCGDGNGCNGQETCQAGTCYPGYPPNGDDMNPCTRDLCLPTLGIVHEPLPDGTACPDGDLCNGDERCQGGLCSPGTLLHCDDGDPCTLDSCHAWLGCQNPRVPGCDPCVHAADCADGNPCTDDVCDRGVCLNTLRLDGSSCADGSPCNGDETCQSGTCTAGTVVGTCLDGDGCCPAGCGAPDDDDCPAASP